MCLRGKCGECCCKQDVAKYLHCHVKMRLDSATSVSKATQHLSAVFFAFGSSFEDSSQ